MRVEVELVRHLLATLAYRSKKAIKDAPDGYPDYTPGKGAMTPLELINHMTHLTWFVKAMLKEDRLDAVRKSKPAPANWDDEIDRLFDSMLELDGLIENYKGDLETLKLITQGPLSDALTHVGQLAYLRRLAGDPIIPESFIKAEIITGKINYQTLN